MNGRTDAVLPDAEIGLESGEDQPLTQGRVKVGNARSDLR